MSMRIRLACCSLLALSSMATDSASAAIPSPYLQSIFPPFPTTDDLVQMRTTLVECTPTPDVTVSTNIAARLVDVRFTAPSIPCDPSDPTHRPGAVSYTAIGRLPAGTYRVFLRECQRGIGGGEHCGGDYDWTFVVQQGIRPHAIPVLSWLATVGLIAVLLLVARRSSAALP